MSESIQDVFAKLQREVDHAKALRSDQYLIDHYGFCWTCSAPRTEVRDELDNEVRVTLVCTRDLSHSVDGQGAS